MPMDWHHARLRSQYYTPAQLMALGRVAELSALLEVMLRNVLGQVMGLGQAAGEALFLGDPTSRAVARITALGAFADMPAWFTEEAVDWAKRVGAAMSERDNILHRAPVILYDADDEEARVVGWNRARRAHQPTPIDDARLSDLIDRLAELEDEALGKLMWGGWEASVGDARPGGDADAPPGC